jgi:hypothetical protein
MLCAASSTIQANPSGFGLRPNDHTCAIPLTARTAEVHRYVPSVTDLPDQKFPRFGFHKSTPTPKRLDSYFLLNSMRFSRIPSPKMVMDLVWKYCQQCGQGKGVKATISVGMSQGPDRELFWLAHPAEFLSIRTHNSVGILIADRPHGNTKKRLAYTSHIRRRTGRPNGGQVLPSPNLPLLSSRETRLIASLTHGRMNRTRTSHFSRGTTINRNGNYRTE